MCNVAVTSIQLVCIVKVCLCIKINNQGLCSIGLHFSWFRNVCQHYALIASGPCASVLYIFAMVATMPLIEPLNMKLTSSIEIHDGLICSSKSDLLLFLQDTYIASFFNDVIYREIFPFCNVICYKNV